MAQDIFSKPHTHGVQWVLHLSEEGNPRKADGSLVNDAAAHMLISYCLRSVCTNKRKLIYDVSGYFFLKKLLITMQQFSQ